MTLRLQSLLLIPIAAILVGCGFDRQQNESTLDTSNSPDQHLFAYADVAFDRLAKDGYANLSLVDKTFVCVWGLEGEVNNGGFDQYYFNSSGDWALDTPGALRAIGANTTAGIVERGNALFGDLGPSRDSTLRQSQLDNLSESSKNSLNDLDAEFYRYNDNLSALLTEFLERSQPPKAK